MVARNGLLVRVEDSHGAFGWGEIWCNFPPAAPISRLRLLEDVITPELIGQTIETPADLRPHLEARWKIMATHVGEPGPFGHCIAGLDMAVWDLAARRSGKPLATYLNGCIPKSVNVYASTIHPVNAPKKAHEFLEAGHRAFKLKVGLGDERDEEHVASVREAIGPNAKIMVDANQKWTLDQAVASINRLANYDLTFVEEPIFAESPMTVWQELARRSRVLLAAGENICSDASYESHLSANALTFYQPDVAKWGGIGGCFEVGQKIAHAGHVYNPHYMGTGLGLAASLHLLAAVGGDGFVELDSNANLLRTDLCDFDQGVSEGKIQVPDGVGTGVVPDPKALDRFRIS